MNELSSSEHIRELKIDSTLWATPTKIINLLDFKPKNLSIDTKINGNNNTPDPNSKDLIKIHQVRYKNDGFYLTIDNIKDDNVGGILDMILTDDQKNKYHQVWKEVFRNLNGRNGELKLHEKIRLFNSNLPIEKIFKIPSIIQLIFKIPSINKSLIEKNNKFHLELALNHCLYEI